MAETPEEVLLFVPNLIGYSRIALTLASVYLALDNWQLSMYCYLASFILDFFDGLAARQLDQCSDFGGVLDMVTDRTSTACLLLVCAHLYAPAHGGLALLFFGSLVMLDVFSHWLHMLAAAKAPAGKHHKDTGDSSFFLVRFYYGCYPFFGYCCVGTEVFYVLLYVRSFVPDATVLLDVGGFAFTLWHFCFAVCAPACTVKQICNFSQLYSGAISLAALDVEARAAKKKK